MDKHPQRLTDIFIMNATWNRSVFVVTKIFVLLNALFLFNGCDSTDDTSPPWNPDDIPEYFTIDDRDIDYPGTSTTNSIVSLTGRVFNDSSFTGQFGCIVDGLLPPSSGVTVTWLNTANGATESSAAYWTTTSYGVCGVVWVAKYIPLVTGENEIILTANGVSGRSAELRIIISKISPAPRNFVGLVCNGPLTFYWLNHLFDAASFDFFYSTNPDISVFGRSEPDNVEGVTRVANVSPPFVPAGLNSNTTYYFRVAGISNEGEVLGVSREIIPSSVNCYPDPLSWFEDRIVEMPGHFYFDFDDGVVSTGYTFWADIYWEPIDDSDAPYSGRIVPENEAMIHGENWLPKRKYTSMGIDAMGGTLGYHEYGDQFYENPDLLNHCFGICLGDVFRVRTRNGNYAKVQILEYKPESRLDGTSNYLVFRYHTYYF